MHTQNCLFWALECLNRAHSDFDKVMEAFFFIRGRRPGLEAAGRGTTSSPGAGSPAPASAPSTAGGLEGSSAGRAPFSPEAGAGAAGASGGAGGAGAALLNPSSLPTRLLPGWSERSPDAPSNVAIEEAQHFEKIVVKSVFGEVWFRSDCRHDIINEVADDNLPLKTDALTARGFEGIV